MAAGFFDANNHDVRDAGAAIGRTGDVLASTQRQLRVLAEKSGNPALKQALAATSRACEETSKLADSFEASHTNGLRF